MKIRRRKFNISVLGETTVGKTCIIRVGHKYEFQEEGIATIGIDSFKMTKTIDNFEYIFNFFDTPGAERFRYFSSQTLKKADGIFMIFSVDDKNSFEKAIKWIDFIDDYVNLEYKVLYLVGNKIDREERVVTKEEAEILAKSKKIKYFETSARTQKGINEVFEEMFMDIYEKYKMDNEKEINDQFKLDKKNNKKKQIIFMKYLKRIIRRISTIILKLIIIIKRRISMIILK